MHKEYSFGNSKVIVYSPLTQMSKKEQRAYFQEQWKKGNPILQEIAKAAQDCLLDHTHTRKQA